MMYERLLRPVLFRYGGGDPEKVHEQTLASLSRPLNDSLRLKR